MIHNGIQCLPPFQSKYYWLPPVRQGTYTSIKFFEELIKHAFDWVAHHRYHAI